MGALSYWLIIAFLLMKGLGADCFQVFVFIKFFRHLKNHNLAASSLLYSAKIFKNPTKV